MKRASFYGRGTGQKILLDNIICQGNEMNLINCQHLLYNNSDFNCALDHSEDAGVKCGGKSSRVRNVRLCQKPMTAQSIPHLQVELSHSSTDLYVVHYLCLCLAVNIRLDLNTYIYGTAEQ